MHPLNDQLFVQVEKQEDDDDGWFSTWATSAKDKLISDSVVEVVTETYRQN